MFIVRPVRKEDLEDLKLLAASAQKGMTTLPNDEVYLKERILGSMRAFEHRLSKPGGEAYLFVLEDTDSHKIIGTSGILSKVGGFEPYYTYKLVNEEHACKELNIRKEVPVLIFTINHNGPTEIGSLFLLPQMRKRNLARLLSLGRLLFMAEYPDQFDKTVISELRGIINDQGQSPFWESVGSRFFDTDFYTADFLSGTGQKDFIAKLMPRHPIYVPLLPAEAQEVIGKVHREAEPALSLLQEEGFAFNGEVDIFDAGPTVSASLSGIRTVKSSRRAQVRTDVPPADVQDYIITNTLLDLRACMGGIKKNKDGTVGLSKKVEEGLKIRPGDAIRFAPID